MVGFIGIIKATDKRCREAKGEIQIAKKMLTCTTMHLTGRRLADNITSTIV